MDKVICKKVGNDYTVQIGTAQPVKVKPNKFDQLELPTNPLNRKYVSIHKMTEANKFTITYETPSPAKSTGPRGERPSIAYTEADAKAIADIDAKIADLQAKRKAINVKYATKKPTQNDLMVAAIAKNLGKTEAEVRKAIADHKAGK